MKEWKKPQLVELGTNMTETYNFSWWTSGSCNPPEDETSDS